MFSKKLLDAPHPNPAVGTRSDNDLAKRSGG